MKKFLVVFAGIIFLSVFLSSCNAVSDNTATKKIDTQQLYEKYKTMITEGEGCIPCVDCAALALAINYNTREEIIASKKKLIEYYKKNGEIPCPELVPEVKKEVARLSK